MLVVVLSVTKEVQRLQLKSSSWSLARLTPLHFTCIQAPHVVHHISRPRRRLLHLTQCD